MRQAGAQIVAVDEAHRREQDALMLTGLEDVDHVRMVDRRGEPALADEAPPKAGIDGERGVDHLDRRHPPEHQIGRPVDGAHTAAADELVDPVLREGRPDQRVVRHPLHDP